jgi:hypothetical protein
MTAQEIEARITAIEERVGYIPTRRETLWLIAELRAARKDTERIDAIQTGLSITPTFEPRGEAFRAIDETLLSVRSMRHVSWYAASAREALDAAIAAATPSGTTETKE